MLSVYSCLEKRSQDMCTAVFTNMDNHCQFQCEKNFFFSNENEVSKVETMKLNFHVRKHGLHDGRTHFV